jgi:hypothetical protein
MNEARIPPPSRYDFRRAAFEWSGLSFLLLSIVLLVTWVITQVYPNINQQLAWHEVDATIANGSTTLSNNQIDDIAAWDQWETRPTDINRPLVRKVNFPGLRYRFARYQSGSDTWERWVLQISFLPLFLAAASLASICLWRYRAAVAKLQKDPEMAPK